MVGAFGVEQNDENEGESSYQIGKPHENEQTTPIGDDNDNALDSQSNELSSENLLSPEEVLTSTESPAPSPVLTDAGSPSLHVTSTHIYFTPISTTVPAIEIEELTQESTNSEPSSIVTSIQTTTSTV